MFHVLTPQNKTAAIVGPDNLRDPVKIVVDTCVTHHCKNRAKTNIFHSEPLA